MLQISYLMGKPRLRDVLGNHFKDRLFHLVHWLSITLCQDSINLERKSHLDGSSDTHCTRGNLEGWRTGCRPWGVGDDGRIGNLLKKTQYERGDISQKTMKIYFSNRRWTNQTSWRRSGPENIHHGTASTNSRRKSRWFSWRIRRVSSTTSRLIFRMPVNRYMISGPCQETSYTAITLNQESNFTRREKNHSLFHWNTLTYPELLTRTWMSSKNDASMIIVILMGQEICLILGQVSLNLLFWKKNLQKDICGLGRDWRENSWHPGQIIYGQNSGRKWERMPNWRRGKSGHMKNLNSTMLENCEGSISLTRRTRNFRRPSRMLARNWKHQRLPLCLARSARTTRVAGMVINPIRSNRNLRVFWNPVNLQGRVWENLYGIIMKTILREKETIHCSITIWFTNLFLCPKPWKFQQQRQEWTRNGKIWRNFRRGTWRESEVRKRWSMKQARRAQKFISPHWWTNVIWQMLNWRQSTKNTKVELYSEVIL